MKRHSKNESDDDDDDGNQSDEQQVLADTTVYQEEETLHPPQDDDDPNNVTTVKAKRKRKRKQGKSKSGVTNNNTNDEDGASSTTKQSKVIVVPEIQRTLYMEGLPFDCTVENVREFFSETHGCTDIDDLRLPLWQDTKRLRGYGHIVFSSVETTQRALREVNGQYLQGRYLQLQQAREKKGENDSNLLVGTNTTRDQPAGCHKIFVKNLPYDATEAEVEEAFKTFGKIIGPGGVRLARNYMTKEPKGFGYVEFKNPEGAFAAVMKSTKADGICIKGRRVIVDYDEGRIKGSFRAEDGRNWKKVYGGASNNHKRKLSHAKRMIK
jgi:nucleolin